MRLLICVTAVSVSLAGCHRSVDASTSTSASASLAAPAAAADPGSTATSPDAAPATPVAAADRPATVPAAATSASVRDLTIPSGTPIPVVLDTAVGSATSRVEQPVQAHVSQPVIVRGVTVIPAGSRVSGVVTDATRSARVKGRAHVALRFDTLVPANDDARYAIRTTAVGRTAPSTKEKDALEIAGPAAGGALIGALVGGKKGALIGTAAGGGAGTAFVLSSRGKEVQLPRGSRLTLRLSQPLTIAVKR
jgi:hypothetical protein